MDQYFIVQVRRLLPSAANCTGPISGLSAGFLAAGLGALATISDIISPSFHQRYEALMGILLINIRCGLVGLRI